VEFGRVAGKKIVEKYIKSTQNLRKMHANQAQSYPASV